jgi:quinol monooxygenase YgiN
VAFIQIIDARTTKIDELRRLDDEWQRATEGKRTARRSILGRDRNDPGRYVLIVFFDSYESAMENSNLPETQRMAAEMATVIDGPPTYLDLEVVEDRS